MNCLFNGCANTKRITGGLCEVHYGRKRRGVPLDSVRGLLDGSQEFRFWQRVAVTANPDKCWEWQMGTDKDGYGQTRFDGKKAKSHVVAFLLSGGEFTQEKRCVIHSCDNPKCCNPHHLSAATMLENMQQAFDRHRLLRCQITGRLLSPKSQAVSQQGI